MNSKVIKRILIQIKIFNYSLQGSIKIVLIGIKSEV